MIKSKMKPIADTIRGLSLDMVDKASSGHVGLPLGCSELISVIYSDIMKHNPDDTKWIDRDRFVLSAGHGSALLYSILHLSGYDITIDDLKNFRQLESKTPGHPEYGITPGVEVTTGPLGQGVSNAVGMALAEKLLSTKFNTNKHDIINHYTYCLAGDGCLMEGISSEASSLAGHLGLGKLIMFYDNNNITIDGMTDISFTEDVGKRYEAYNWHVQYIDGYNYDEIIQAVKNAKKENSKPSIIITKTIPGKGLVKYEGSNKSHGNPMNHDDVIESKKKLGINESFYVSDDIRSIFREIKEEHEKVYNEWKKKFNEWKNENPKLNKELDIFMRGTIDLIDKELFNDNEIKPMATRAISGKVINKLSEYAEFLIGGSADLSGSNKTTIDNSDFISKNNFNGKNIHFGVREHAMGGIINGIALHGGLRPYGATFLVFSDYVRPSVRLSALMDLPVIYVFTHDSIQVGEDGPTHQPIEHVQSLRNIPNLYVIRPYDFYEVSMAWKYALQHNDKAFALVLTRQKINPLCELSNDDRAFNKGAYIIRYSKGKPNIQILASGSEVEVAFKVAEIIETDYNKNVEVVSIPSLEIFEEQSEDYKKSIIKKDIRNRVSIEFGVSSSWYKYIGDDGLAIGINRFGESAPNSDLIKYFEFEASKIAQKIYDNFYSK